MVESSLVKQTRISKQCYTLTGESDHRPFFKRNAGAERHRTRRGTIDNEGHKQGEPPPDRRLNSTTLAYHAS